MQHSLHTYAVAKEFLARAAGLVTDCDDKHDRVGHAADARGISSCAS